MPWYRLTASEAVNNQAQLRHRYVRPLSAGSHIAFPPLICHVSYSLFGVAAAAAAAHDDDDDDAAGRDASRHFAYLLFRAIVSVYARSVGLENRNEYIYHYRAVSIC
jgi:hypothetical protein